MKVNLRHVYYCEYCNKHRLRSDVIKKHEKHCTLNPNRECRLCGNKNIKSIIKKYHIRKKFSLKDIKKDVGDCPNCILTVLRCVGLDIFEFNYKEALKEWWDNENQDKGYY